ncbi:hypothetical protein [Actinoallomurus liliacearum]|uniref:hypothetical protein n=1 Tax=Actinoallomurus liliacearum TaxID=1080073 RepID=UPI0031EA2623
MIDGLGDAHALMKPPRFETGLISDVVVVVSWVPALSFNYGQGGIHPDSVGVDVVIRPVRSIDRVAVRSLLRSQGLPQLRGWVRQAQTAAETWKSRGQHGYWRYARGELLFAGDRPE